MDKLEKTDERLSRAKLWFYTVWAVGGVIVLLVMLSYALNILSIPVGVLIWTVIFVFCLRGVVSGLEKRNINRALGTTIAYVIMALVIAFIVFLMVSPSIGLGGQFASLAQSAPGYANQVIDWATDLYNQYSYYFNDDTVRSYIQQASSALGSAAQELARTSANGVFSFGSGVANTLMIIGFALVIAFWILMELPSIGRECNRLIAGSKHEEDLRMLHLTTTRVMGGYIKATLLQCAVIAFACAVLFFFAGIPNFAAVAVITGVLNIIPVVGPWLGGAIAALLGLFTSPIVAVVSLVGTIVIQQFVYTFISPNIMKDSVDIHPALTLICLLVGSSLGGSMSGLAGSILGMLIAIPAAAVIKSAFVYYFEKNTGKELVAPDGVFFQGTPSEGEGVDPMADAVSPHPGTTAKFKKIGPVGYEAMVDKKNRQAAVEEHKARIEEHKAAVEAGTESRTPVEGIRSMLGGRSASTKQEGTTGGEEDSSNPFSNGQRK